MYFPRWEEGGLGRYRVDPHSDKDMEGLGGVWRFVGCADEMDAACTPQRVPRWRYIGHEREHQSVDHLLVKPKVYVGTVTKVLLDEEKRARGVEFVDNKGQIFQLEARKEVILAAGVVNTPKVGRAFLGVFGSSWARYADRHFSRTSMLKSNQRCPFFIQCAT